MAAFQLVSHLSYIILPSFPLEQGQDGSTLAKSLLIYIKFPLERRQCGLVKKTVRLRILNTRGRVVQSWVKITQG